MDSGTWGLPHSSSPQAPLHVIWLGVAAHSPSTAPAAPGSLSIPEFNYLIEVRPSLLTQFISRSE